MEQIINIDGLQKEKELTEKYSSKWERVTYGLINNANDIKSILKFFYTKDVNGELLRIYMTESLKN